MPDVLILTLGIFIGGCLALAIRDQWPNFLHFVWCEKCREWVYYKVEHRHE